MVKKHFNIKAVAYFLFYLVFSITFLWILSLTFRINYIQYPVAILASIIVLASLFFLISKSDMNKLKTNYGLKKEILFISLFFIGTLAVTMYIGLESQVGFLWDFGTVQRNAFEIAKTGNYLDISYFARYPNNNMMLLISVAAYKLIFMFAPSASIFSMYKVIIAGNSLLISISILFIYLSSRRVWNRKVAVMSVGITYLFTPILLYSEIFYTDTLGLFFVSLVMYLNVETRKSSNKRNNIVLLIIMGMAIGIGYRLKAFVIILAMAIIIELLLSNINWRKKIQKSLVLLVSVGITLVVTTIIFNQFIPTTKESKDENEFPLTHWVMMGLNVQNDGRYSQDDFELSLTAKSYEEKKELQIATIKKRIDSFDSLGLLKFLFVNKMTRTWADGTMMTDYYGSRESIKQGYLLQFYDKEGQYNYGFHVYFQIGIFIIWCFVLIGSLLYKKRNTTIDFMNISIFGLIIFQLIWECNARYIYCFIPLFILSATNGTVVFNSIIRKLESKKIKPI
ncbi:hypothetical protein IGI37_001174 [Enterococcus sp. AZ194]|uniref:glycosyltransferase family 39 protein n=1 Tax=Enterococcus sp. AZ194 TaxID=2774629 RepID=UPI003F261847